jgi:micrococcal nuclease
MNMNRVRNVCTALFCGCLCKINAVSNIFSYIYNDMEYLDKITYENTIPFIPPITSGKVVKVYDGDTFTLAAKLPNTDGPVYRFTVRLNGIDTPEIKGKTATEKELAKRARDALSSLIMNKIIILKNVETEKYGRLLAEVYVDDININNYMVDNKYAVKYDGGTKERPEEWN